MALFLLMMYNVLKQNAKKCGLIRRKGATLSLTRGMLKAMAIEDEKIDQIIDAHGETVSALKEQRDKYKKSADEAESLRKEIAELKAIEPDAYKEKYEAEHKAFEEFKARTAEKETKAEKAKLYENLLTDAGIDPKRIGSILKLTDLETVEIENGKIKNAEELTESAKSEWADFIVKRDTVPAKVVTPPTNAGGKTITKEDIMSIKDRTARRAAIAENMELFGKTE